MSVTEAQTQRAVLEYLAAKKVWHRRMNSGAIKNATGRPVRFGRAGMADVLVLQFIRKNLDIFQAAVWLEIKSPLGQQSPAQKEFQREVEAEGHTYLVIRDINEVIEFFGG